MAQAGSRKRARRSAARPSSATPKYVYSFAGGKAEGSSALRNLLGGKGCELAQMTKMGVPVPPRWRKVSFRRVISGAATSRR